MTNQPKHKLCECENGGIGLALVIIFYTPLGWFGMLFFALCVLLMRAG